MPRGGTGAKQPEPSAAPSGPRAKGGNPLAVTKVALKAGGKKEGAKEGVKPVGDVVVDIVEVEKKKKELSDQLRKCEVQIHRLETQYLETANPQGNALRGYEGLLYSTAVSDKKAAFRGEDRIFSGSSTSGRGAGGG